MNFLAPIPNPNGPWQNAAGARFSIFGGTTLTTNAPVTAAASVAAFAASQGLTLVNPPTLASLAASLNAALTAIFKTAPIQAQITFSNLAGANGSITQLIDAGQLALAEAALQGMLTDQLVPPGYSAFIDPAVAAIAAAAPGFAALTPAAPATTPPAN